MNNQYNVNWVDGMKINKTHFIHNDQVRQYDKQLMVRSLVKDHAFGLLPTPSSNINLPLRKEQHKIWINNCRALIKNGLIISIKKDYNLFFDTSNTSKKYKDFEGNLLLVVSADPLERVAVGEPFANELPPRLPFSRPKLMVEIIKEEQYSHLQYANIYVPLGRLQKVLNDWSLDEEYIPPCTQILSHVKLFESFKIIENLLFDINTNALEVIQNAQSKKRRGEINDLAENTFYLLEKVVFYLAGNIDTYSNINPDQRPIQAISLLKGLGKVVLTSLKCMKSVNKEALLRYYESHLGLKAHEFEDKMDQLSKATYNHLKLNDLMGLAINTVESFRNFVKKAVNLEFHSVERVDVLHENTIKRNKLDIF